MAASTTLTRLLSELKSVRSPLDRMRVVARAWRSLRRMRPEERKVLAGQVGMEGAEEILEGLGRGEKRLAPVLVLRALEKAKKAEPSQLRGLLDGLKDRDKRGTLLQKWLDSVAEGLDDQEDDEPAEAAPAPEPVPEPAAKPAGPEKTAAQPTGAIPVARPPVAIPVGSPLPKLPPEPKVKPAAPEPKRRRVPPPVPVPLPAPWRKPAAAVKSAPPAAPKSAAVLPGGEELAHRLHRTEGLMARFRLLRSGLDSNGGSVGDVAGILEAFPAGWARRRALVALLRHQIPTDLGRALALIEEQESAAARRWCLGTILNHWELSTKQEDLLRRRRRSASS